MSQWYQHAVQGGENITWEDKHMVFSTAVKEGSWTSLQYGSKS